MRLLNRYLARVFPPASLDRLACVPPAQSGASRAILPVWSAGRVRRWHMSAVLSGTDDFLDGHCGRVARIILALDPDARAALIAAALTHDDGEHVTGDISGPRKRAMPWPVLADLEAAEAAGRFGLWGRDFGAGLSAAESAFLHLADQLDGFLWVRLHRPDELRRPDWRRSAAAIEATAASLGFARDVRPLLVADDARGRGRGWRRYFSTMFKGRNDGERHFGD
jgi:hypothetical protein